MSVVEDLETRFMPCLKTAAADLQTKFPRWRISTRSSPIGGLTEYQGHVLGIDCLLPDTPADHPDNESLYIGVMHLTTDAKISDASVCWGAGGGTEMDLLEDPVPYSAESMSFIEMGLPQLIEALQNALRRGHPS